MRWWCARAQRYEASRGGARGERVATHLVHVRSGVCLGTPVRPGRWGVGAQPQWLLVGRERRRRRGRCAGRARGTRRVPSALQVLLQAALAAGLDLWGG